MRHFVLALMIALLPIRGWVGDAMAMQMAGLAAPAVSGAHLPCADMAHDAGSDVRDSAGFSDLSAMQSAPQSTESHPHLACDLCNGPALAMSEPIAVAKAQVSPQRAPRLELFASATLPQGVKPPIS